LRRRERVTSGWDPKYSVGVEQLDRQHQTIFEVLARLELPTDLGDGAALGEGLAALFGEAAFHFRAEEEFLSVWHYPGLVEQRALHGQFLERLAALEREPSQTSLETLGSLRHWLEVHMVEADQRYAAWIREHAAAAHREKKHG
jgi:hemerythrin